jgi:hypothetical protein
VMRGRGRRREGGEAPILVAAARAAAGGGGAGGGGAGGAELLLPPPPPARHLSFSNGFIPRNGFPTPYNNSLQEARLTVDLDPSPLKSLVSFFLEVGLGVSCFWVSLFPGWEVKVGMYDETGIAEGEEGEGGEAEAVDDGGGGGGEDGGDGDGDGGAAAVNIDDAGVGDGGEGVPVW